MAIGFVSRSPEQTAALAAGLARLLKPGDVIFLRGQLGAGKTFFIRAAARELGVSEPVTSPSFAMGQTYEGKITIHHLDLYRLASFSDEDLADFEPFFESGSITFVEWPEAAETFLARPAVLVVLEHVDEQSRHIMVESSDPEIENKLEGLVASLGH